MKIYTIETVEYTINGEEMRDYRYFSNKEKRDKEFAKYPKRDKTDIFRVNPIHLIGEYETED